jgi:DNA-binding transcriptional LysR family regulator
MIRRIVQKIARCLAMDLARLSAFDLNLLVVFEVLLDERNVTRAARRLGLSQSAVSNALARLREALDDPVLVRAANGMVPTSRAVALQRQVGEALQHIGAAIDGDTSFEPARAHRTFVVAATDYVQFVLLGALVERLRKAAPGVVLQVATPARDFPWSGLESGAVDLIVTSNRAGPAPRGLHRRWLFRDTLACVLRADHPLVAHSRDLSLDDYLGLDHIEALPLGSVGLADEILATLGRRRRIVLTVPNFLIAPHVVAQSDCCFTLANRIAGPLTTRLPLARRAVPFATPTVAIGAFWHDRVHKDPAHRWLRRLIIDTATAVDGDGGELP